MDLDLEQLSYVTTTALNNVVIGHPGSGKTTCLEGRIRYLLGAPRFLSPSSQLVLTFFKATQQNLLSRLEGVFGTRCSQQVRTVHSVCYAICGGRNGHSIDLTTVIVRTLRQPDHLLRPHFDAISHIYVDEAQVLNQTMIEFLIKIRRSCPWISLDLLGDPAQGIWNRVESVDEEFMTRWVSGEGQRYELVNNYRSSRSVVAFCNLTRPQVASSPMRAQRDDEGDVTLVVGSREVQKQHFLHSVASRLAQGGSLAAICANRHSHPSMPDHVCGQDVNNWLRDAGYSVSVWYDETRSRGDNTGSRGQREPGATMQASVVVTTTHQALGSEFDHCYVFAYHHKTNKRIPTVGDHYHHTKMQHVAKTRARQTLTLFASADMHLFLTPQSALDIVTRRGERSPKLLTCYGSPPAPHKRHFRAADDEEDDVAVIKWGSLHALEERRLIALQDLYATSSVPATTSYVFGPLKLTEDDSLVEFAALKTMYGSFAENCVYAGFVDTPPEQKALQKFCASNLIVISSTTASVESTQYVMKKLNLIDNRMQTKVKDIQKIRQQVESTKRGAQTQQKRSNVVKWQAVLKLLDHILGQAAELGDVRVVLLHFETPGRWCDMGKLEEWAYTTPADETYLDVLFEICLFWWQYENQAGYRMTMDHNEHKAALRRWIPYWTDYGKSLEGAQTQVSCSMSYEMYESKRERYESKRIMGCADIVTNDTVIELKLAKGGISPVHQVQVRGYAQMIDIERFGSDFATTELGCAVVNLFTGERLSLATSTSPPPSSNDIFHVLFAPHEDTEQDVGVGVEPGAIASTSGLLIDPNF